MSRSVLIFILFSFFACTPVYGSNQIKMVVDEREITDLPAPPIIRENSVLVPAREAFENLGAEVAWDGPNRQIYILYQSQFLIMTLDQRTAILDGEFFEMAIPPILYNNKTMIPLRFPAECFGFGVEWNGEERTAYLYSPIPYVDPDEEDETPLEEPEWYPETELIVSPPEVTTPSAADPDALARDKSPTPITQADFPETNIITLHTPREMQTAAYALHASSPISNVEKFLLADNRLVIDIYNANCFISGPFYFDDTVPITDIRASQFMDYPKVTRLVFDLKGAAEFAVSLSDDRLTLLISFEQNMISEVRFASTGVSDSITIVGNSLPLVSISQAQNPDRYVIAITNAAMNISGEESVHGVFTHLVRVWQDNDAGYVEAIVNEWPTHIIEYGTNAVTIRFYPNNLSGMRYDYQNRELHISKESGFYMDINAVSHFNDYARNRYTLTLPVNAEEFIGNGELSVRDGLLDAVSVEQDSFGYTRLVMHVSRVLAFSVHETDQTYVIRTYSPNALYPRVVIMDPGHGGSAPGSTSGGQIEKNINLSITLKLMQLLDADPSITVYYTRTDDRDVSLVDRAAFANQNGDIFISIHANAIKNNSTANGIETWYYPHYNDGHIGFNSEQLAYIMQRNLIATTGAFDRGIKTEEPPAVVLRETVIPAVLLEVGFMTNPNEVARLADENYQWQIARGIYNGIVEAFTVYVPKR